MLTLRKRIVVMASGNSPAPGVTTFSTDALAARDRFAVGREVVGPGFLRLEISLVRPHPFHASGALFAAPDLGILWALNSGIRMDRSRAMLADGGDDLVLPLVRAGRHFAAQCGRETTLDARMTTLLSTAETGSVSCAAASRAVGLKAPRERLAGADLENRLGEPLSRDQEAFRLLAGYVERQREALPSASPALRSLVVAHLHDLLALALAPSRDNAVRHGRGVRAARLGAIQADILANPALSVAGVAKRQGVTPRHDLLTESF